MIGVKIHSGDKGEERPLALVLNGKELIVEIIRRELKEDYEMKERREIFTVSAGEKFYRREKDQRGNWRVYEK